MDIDKIKQTADKTGGTIDSIWNALFTKGRFWKLLVIALVAGLVWFVYLVVTEPIEEVEKELPIVGEVEEVLEGEPSITKGTFMIDSEGYRKDDTIYIDYWSDGFVDRYYTDGEAYKD